MTATPAVLPGADRGGRLTYRRNARMPIATGALLLMALLVFVAQASEALDYERHAIRDGQLYRIWTGHLTHWSWSHLGWNALGLGALGWLAEAKSRRRLLWVVALSATIIPLLLYTVSPALESYRGLSGLVSTLFAWQAIALIRQLWGDGARAAAMLAGACAVGFTAHCATAWLAGDAVLVSGLGAKVAPVPLAHAVGIALGVVAAKESSNF